LEGRDSSAQERAGYYVIVASARNEAPIGVKVIEEVAACTSWRPHLGRTQPSAGGFSVPAYAVYFGPYASRSEASDRRMAVTTCVPDAYLSVGNIQRY
jgi:hypothetical protein